jgi:hypothetical protein
MNGRQRKKAEKRKKQHSEYLAKCQKENELREAQEEYKRRLISGLTDVRSELSEKRNRVLSCIESEKEEQLKEHEKRMGSFVMDCLSKSSTEQSPESPQFQLDESFLQFISNKKPILEKISEQISFIGVLIEKISSNSSDILKSEQRIINILSAKSFLRSQVVGSVQIMIDLCSNMRDCLPVLVTYSEQIMSQMGREIKFKYNPNLYLYLKDFLNEFRIDSIGLKLQHQNLNELLQALSELTGNIDEMKTSFSEKYSIECLFMEYDESDEFSSVFERTQKLNSEIEEMKRRFYEVKEFFLNFVQSKFNFLYDFVKGVRNDEYQYSVGDSENVSDDKFFWDNYSEPAGELRQRLEYSLNRIKDRRV